MSMDLNTIRSQVEPAVRAAVKVDITQSMYDSLVILAIKNGIVAPTGGTPFGIDFNYTMPNKLPIGPHGKVAPQPYFIQETNNGRIFHIFHIRANESVDHHSWAYVGNTSGYYESSITPGDIFSFRIPPGEAPKQILHARQEWGETINLGREMVISTIPGDFKDGVVAGPCSSGEQFGPLPWYHEDPSPGTAIVAASKCFLHKSQTYFLNVRMKPNTWSSNERVLFRIIPSGFPPKTTEYKGTNPVSIPVSSLFKDSGSTTKVNCGPKPSNVWVKDPLPWETRPNTNVEFVELSGGVITFPLNTGDGNIFLNFAALVTSTNPMGKVIWISDCPGGTPLQQFWQPKHFGNTHNLAVRSFAEVGHLYVRGPSFPPPERQSNHVDVQANRTYYINVRNGNEWNRAYTGPRSPFYWRITTYRNEMGKF